MESFRDNIVPYIIEFGLSIIFAVLILVVGWIVARWTKRKILEKGEQSDRLDPTLTKMFAQVGQVLIMVFVVIAVLGQFGVQTASLIAVLGAVGFAIGLAWDGVLADFAAGIMLLTMRPFKVGESIDFGGTKGVVDEVGIITTKMHTFDNLAMTVPNSEIWGNVITNYATNDKRRVDMTIGFGYDDDIDAAYRVIREVLADDDRILDEPEPQVAINELGGSSVNMIVRPWTRKEDYWPLKFDLTERIKRRFDEEGINFPYPSHDVYLHRDENGQ